MFSLTKFLLFCIVYLQEGIAVGRTFAALNNYQVDGNKEMMAIGLMNMAGSCSSCYVTTGMQL
jgi:sulfate transporter 3